MSTQWRTNTLDANRQTVYRPLQDLNIWNHVFLKGYLGHNSCLHIFYSNCQRIFEGLWTEIILLKYNIYILGRRGIKIICLLFQIERPVFNFEGLSPTSHDITLIGQPCLQNSTGQAKRWSGRDNGMFIHTLVLKMHLLNWIKWLTRERWWPLRLLKYPALVSIPEPCYNEPLSCLFPIPDRKTSITGESTQNRNDDNNNAIKT